MAPRSQGPLPDPDRLELWARRALASSELADLGRHWYRRAGAWCAGLARAHGRPAANVQCAAAALSPQVSWADEMRHLPGFVAAAAHAWLPPPFPGFGRSHRRALAAILEPHDGNPLRHLGGPKVRAFARALMGDPCAGVIDRHMVRILWPEPPPSLTAHRYRLAVGALDSAAARIGLPAAEVQALAWVAYVNAEVRAGADLEAFRAAGAL